MILGICGAGWKNFPFFFAEGGCDRCFDCRSVGDDVCVAYIFASARYIYCMKTGADKGRKRDALIVCGVGLGFSLAVGSLSHFFYEWSGGSTAAGIFFPVNESVWEHMKLVFFPFLVYFATALPLAPTLSNRVFGAFSATFVAAGFIPAVFYTYTAFTGRAILAVDITVYCAGVFLGFAVAYSAFTRPRSSAALCAAGALGLVFIAACYFTLTAFAPDFFLFVDPRNGKFGLGAG